MKPTVLCYHLKGTKKGRQIAMIFGYLGYKIRHIEPKEYQIPIGVLVGINQPKQESFYEGEEFTDEMLVMYVPSEELLDKALFLMRKEKVQVPLKAMVTETNQNWTSMELYEEILKEHKFMAENNRNIE